MSPLVATIFAGSIFILLCGPRFDNPLLTRLLSTVSDSGSCVLYDIGGNCMPMPFTFKIIQITQRPHGWPRFALLLQLQRNSLLTSTRQLLPVLLQIFDNWIVPLVLHCETTTTTCLSHNSPSHTMEVEAR